jgi:hypothetical protein
MGKRHDTRGRKRLSSPRQGLEVRALLRRFGTDGKAPIGHATARETKATSISRLSFLADSEEALRLSVDQRNGHVGRAWNSHTLCSHEPFYEIRRLLDHVAPPSHTGETHFHGAVLCPETFQYPARCRCSSTPLRVRPPHRPTTSCRTERRLNRNQTASCRKAKDPFVREQWR